MIDKTRPTLTRRGLVRAAAGLAATGAVLGGGVAEAAVEIGQNAVRPQTAPDAVEPFWGPHQGGITTAVQSHSYFAALDLETTQREDVIKMLRAWTTAAAQMTAGQTASPIGVDLMTPGPNRRGARAAAGSANRDVWVWGRIICQGWERPVSLGGKKAGSLGRFAHIPWRSAGRDEHRR